MSAELTLALLCAFSALAGFIDAVAGGGGLVQVPALLVLQPQADIPTLLGTNKCASIFGTANATWRYCRRVTLPWLSVAPMAIAAFLASFCGARTVSLLDPALLKPLVLILMLLVLAYTLAKKDFGSTHKPRLTGNRAQFLGGIFGLVIGFYDGFFGPGTGSFLVFGLVGLFGYSFIHASAAAKVINLSTNAAAIAWFAPHGQVWYQLALPMAACNIAGSWLGTHLALKNGTAFVRVVFIVVVSALAAKLTWDMAQPMLITKIHLK